MTITLQANVTAPGTSATGASLSVIYNEGSSAWEAGGSRGSGTLTVTSVSGSRIAGNLDVRVEPLGSGAVTSLQAQFDLPFHDDTIC